MNEPGPSGKKRVFSNDRNSPSVTKRRLETSDKQHEIILTEWLKGECESDSEGINSDFSVPESDHDTDSEQEASDRENINISEDQECNFKSYIEKNQFKWRQFPPTTSSTRTPCRGINKATSNLSETDLKDPYNIWRKFFNDLILQEIVTWTNVKFKKYRQAFKIATELYETDTIEIEAFLGLLVYSAVFKSNHEACDLLFATDGTSRDIFRCTISKSRFLYLLSCLCFDDPDTRIKREKEDETAAITYIFEAFTNNCRNNYNIGRNATIDEMLIGFRGRSHLTVYMPQKPTKYGLVVQAICDSETHYFYDGYIDSGKGKELSEEKNKLQVPTQCVLRLSSDLYFSNRNITADNWYGSVECVEELKKRGLTFVGALKKNKREIPPEFLPKKTREVGSTLYGFTEDITLVSHVSRENKAVLLLSSMHHDQEINEDDNKPEIVSYYLSTKGAVDEIDKMCSNYSCSRRTRRWSMAVFFRMLDLSTINANILYNMHSVEQVVDRTAFMKMLARSLVVPHLQRRFLNSHLQRDLRSSIKRVLGSEAPEIRRNEVVAEDKSIRKLCHICPSKLKRKSAYKCDACLKYVCLQCSKPVCFDCL